MPNYGSQHGLYGNVWQSVKGPQEAREEFPDLMVGIGTFMEGIDNNYIIYEAFYISFLLLYCSSFMTRNGLEKASGYR